MKVRSLLVVIFLLSPFASHAKSSSYINGIRRAPAEKVTEELNCHEALGGFLEKNYADKLVLALEEKKLVQLGDHSIKVRRPSGSLFKSLKSSFHRLLKGLNKKKYSIFYLDSEETAASVAAYPDLLAKKLQNNSTEGGEVLERVDQWVKEYRGYEEDIGNLTAERVTLAYNVNLLKKVKPRIDHAFSMGKSFEAKLSIRENGIDVEKTYIFRKNDGNYAFEISKMRDRIKEIDGGYLGFLLDQGEIRTRVIEQARLHDIVRMHHRELEKYINNPPTELIHGFDLTEETLGSLKNLLVELEKLEAGVEDYSGLLPSDFGIRKILNKKIQVELMNLPRSIKSRYIFKKSEEIADKYLSEDAKERLQLKFKGYAHVFQASGLGAAAYAIYEGGGFVKGLWTWYSYDRTKIDDCNEKAGENNRSFNMCIARFIEEKYPYVFQLKVLDPNFDIFNLEKPSSLSEKEKGRFSDLLERVYSKRSLYLIIKKRQRDMTLDLQEEVDKRFAELEEGLDFGNLLPCVDVGHEYFDKCMVSHLIKFVDNILTQKESKPIEGKLEEQLKLQIKENYKLYSNIPLEVRDEYRQEVESIMHQRVSREEVQRSIGVE